MLALRCCAFAWRCGFRLPDLEYRTAYYRIERWCRMCLEYLKKNHQTWLNRMMVEGMLNDHLHQIDLQYQERCLCTVTIVIGSNTLTSIVRNKDR